jgi:protein-S-isoprenylcysteine O-methyltransferase Ste14
MKSSDGCHNGLWIKRKFSGRIRMNLQLQAVRRLVITLLALALLLFVPAGSPRFWQGWVFLAVLGTCWSYFFVQLLRHDPELVRRRLRAKEPESAQRLLLKLFSGLLYVGFIIAGLDFRFGWSQLRFGGVPMAVIIAGQLGAAAGYWLVFWVMNTNSFAGSTIEVEQGQRVIEAGPYALVRHPMYLGMCITLVAVPLALASFAALPIFALIVPVLMLRLVHEEKTLRHKLPAYEEYCQRTQFRLVPWLW